MEYRRIVWKHDFEDEPVELFTEVDGEIELRKVDVFRNGLKVGADASHSAGSTFVSTDMPSLEEISSDPQFVVHVISKDDFESEWVSSSDA